MTTARVSAGVPTGGQFAAVGHAEAGMTLDDSDGPSPMSEVGPKHGDELAFAYGDEWGQTLRYTAGSEVQPGDSIATAKGLYDVIGPSRAWRPGNDTPAFRVARRGDGSGELEMEIAAGQEVILADRTNAERASRTAAMSPETVLDERTWATYGPHLSKDERAAVIVSEIGRLRADSASERLGSSVTKVESQERIALATDGRSRSASARWPQELTLLDEAEEFDRVAENARAQASAAARQNDMPEYEKWEQIRKGHLADRNAAISQMLQD